MEIDKSLKILELSINYTNKDLDNKYRKLILLYHPDRSLENKEKNTEKFKEVQEAYNILKDYLLNINEKEDKRNKIIIRIEDIIENIMEKGINIIKNINKNSKINIINRKIDVTIDNLINRDVFVIENNSEKLYIPMWHHELVFEIENKKIIVECERNLNKNIIVDDDNNIFVKVFLKLEDLKDRKEINIVIGKNLELNIDISRLFMRNNQTVIFKNRGIPIINEKNIYFEERLSDIYIDITIENLL